MNLQIHNSIQKSAMNRILKMVTESFERYEDETHRYHMIISASVKTLWTVPDIAAIRDRSELYFKDCPHQLPNFGVPDDWNGKSKAFLAEKAMDYFSLTFSEIDFLWFECLPRKERERIARLRAKENYDRRNQFTFIKLQLPIFYLINYPVDH